MSLLADRHIELNARLRSRTGDRVTRLWNALPGYREENLPDWLRSVVPLIEAAQRQQVAITDAYLARALERQPVGVEAAALIGAAARKGTSPADVYTRPFEQVWRALSNGTPFEEARLQGLSRAVSSSAMDVQLAMRDTLQGVGEIDPEIQGYQRVADADACDFCLSLDGAQMRTADPMPLHNFCGCGVEVIVYTRGAANRNNLAKFNETATPKDVAVHEHGELGPVITDPAETFTSL